MIESRGLKSSSDPQHTHLDPGAVFKSPRDVVQRNDLSRQEKLQILRQWQYDAAEGAVALEEGMPGSEDDLPRQINLALEQLQGDIDSEHVGPTKHHGRPR